MVYPNNGEHEFLSYDYTGASYGGDKTEFSVNYYIAADDNGYILSKGKSANISIENMWYALVIMAPSNNFVLRTPTSISGYVIYTDGSVDYISPEFVMKNGTDFDVNFHIDAKKDMQKIVLNAKCPIDGVDGQKFDWTLNLGESDDTDYKLRVDVVDPNTGLLENISSGITNVVNGITDGFKNIGNKLTDVFNSIAELPSKIWGFIENGLKSLFVPDEEYMFEYKDKWDTLLEEKLGAIYQVVNITLESWERIETADEQNTINIPCATINLPDNNKFSFGGYDVQIVPDGFDVLVNALKLMVGIASTILFINGLRKRYDEIMKGV